MKVNVDILETYMCSLCIFLRLSSCWLLCCSYIY